jgi:hypothetical protein
MEQYLISVIDTQKNDINYLVRPIDNYRTIKLTKHKWAARTYRNKRAVSSTVQKLKQHFPKLMFGVKDQYEE